MAHQGVVRNRPIQHDGTGNEKRDDDASLMESLGDRAGQEPRHRSLRDVARQHPQPHVLELVRQEGAECLEDEGKQWDGIGEHDAAADLHAVLSRGAWWQVPSLEPEEVPTDELHPRIFIGQQPVDMSGIEQAGIEHQKKKDRSEERTNRRLGKSGADRRECHDVQEVLRRTVIDSSSVLSRPTL